MNVWLSANIKRKPAYLYSFPVFLFMTLLTNIYLFPSNSLFLIFIVQFWMIIINRHVQLETLALFKNNEIKMGKSNYSPTEKQHYWHYLC